MQQSASQEMAQMILSVVSQIPYAKVATYGQIARLAGLPRHARLVGRVLSQLDKNSGIPWHRVLNAQGHLSLNTLDEQGKHLQLEKLRAEGILYAENKVNLRQYQWDGFM